MDYDYSLPFQGLRFEPSIYSKVFDSHGLLRSFMLTVDFLHRCCRDFLLSSHIQNLLHHWSEGPHDVRMFLVNAIISQLPELQTVKHSHVLSVSMISGLISTLSIPEWRETEASLTAACIVRPTVEALASTRKEVPGGWYIGCVLNTWHEEKSNFLTLAIDFDLRAYCLKYLTEEEVQLKQGRPILDHILRPRFEGAEPFLNIGNSAPNVDMLRRVLDFGADPNSIYQDVSVWALFLCLLADLLYRAVDSFVINKGSYLIALKMMIERGASLVLPCSWVLGEFRSDSYIYDILSYGNYERWPNDLSIVEASVQISQPCYAVADLLEVFRAHIGPEIDELVALARAGLDGSFK